MPVAHYESVTTEITLQLPAIAALKPVLAAQMPTVAALKLVLAAQMPAIAAQPPEVAAQLPEVALQLPALGAGRPGSVEVPEVGQSIENEGRTGRNDEGRERPACTRQQRFAQWKQAKPHSENAVLFPESLSLRPSNLCRCGINPWLLGSCHSHAAV